MPNFTVVYVKGRAVSTGMSFLFEPLGGRTMFELEAPSRGAAYIGAFKHLTKLGFQVSVEKGKSAGSNPLGLTDSEISDAEAAGVPVDTKAASGVRIIKII